MPLILLLLLFVVMYAVMIRPQQKRAREHQALIAAVEIGDEVMTTAGIFGTVVSIEGDVVGVEIAPATVMRVARAAIGRRILPDDFEEPDLDEASFDDDDATEESSVLDEPQVIDRPQIIETPDEVTGPGDDGGHEQLGQAPQTPEARPGNGDGPGPREPS